MDVSDFSRMNFVASIGNYEAPCGYCRSGTTTSLGMVANQMTCEAYQDLLNRGWRRSGTWLYRTLVEDSECPCLPHTIRLDVHKFAPSRAQKQVMRRFEKYLAGASLEPKSEPAAPLTPPLSADVPGLHTVAHDGAQEPGLVFGKQQQDSSEERKRKSHLISPSPPASPPNLPAFPARFPRDAATPTSAQASDLATTVSEAISQAVHGMTEEGVLPEACYPAADVREVSVKQRRLLGPRAVLTTAAAFPLSAAARRAAGSGSLSAQHLAALLAQRVGRMARGSGALWLIEAKQGHLNVMMQPGSSCDFPSSDGSAAMAAEENVCSMSINSRSCSNRTSSMGLVTSPCGGAAAEEQQRGEQPEGRSNAVDTAGVRQRALDAVEHSSPGHISLDTCQWVRTAQEQSCPSLEKASHADVSCRSPEVGMTEIHVDAGYSDPAAARAADSSQLHMAETVPSGRSASLSGLEHLFTSGRMRSRHLEIRMVPMPASRAELAAEYPLYKRYQIMHHHESPEEVKESTFRRFLVDTPLVRRKLAVCPGGQAPDWTYGSYHQQYWIDGELVAVAVLDVLPQCVSSVYFFWEPSLSFLSLGKVSALREIAFVQAAATSCPSLHYYYMGYFISSCPKMRYKGEFRPSDLLCMRSMCWVPLERALPVLDGHMHCTISEVPGALEGLDATYTGCSNEKSDFLSDAALAGTLLYVSGPQGRRLVRLGHLARFNVPQDALCALKEKLRSWRRLVGPGAQYYVHVW